MFIPPHLQAFDILLLRSTAARLKDEQVSGTGIGLGLQPSSLSDVYGGDGGGAGGGVEIIFSNAAP